MNGIQNIVEIYHMNFTSMYLLYLDYNGFFSFSFVVLGKTTAFDVLSFMTGITTFFNCAKVNKMALNNFMTLQSLLPNVKNVKTILLMFKHKKVKYHFYNVTSLQINTTPIQGQKYWRTHSRVSFFLTTAGICRPYVEMAVYNLTSKEASLRDSEIIRFCNDSFQNVPSRNGIEPLKSMVRIQNRTNNAERIECPFYGDYIFSYKGNKRFFCIWTIMT